MAYRNKTYVIFDGDKDIRYFNLMKAWKENDKIDFNFYDAHGLRTITDRAQEETVKRTLRERMKNSKQAIVLIGESTKNLHRFVRWEIELALEMDLPIIAANLDGSRECNNTLCPPILRKVKAVHVSFGLKIIKYALDNFPEEFAKSKATWDAAPRHYAKGIYDSL